MTAPEIPSHLVPQVWREKLADYVLDGNSTQGQHKARLFRSILDLGPEDADDLREQLLDGVATGTITHTRATAYGLRYQVDIEIQGNNDKTANVDTVWQVEQDEITLKFLTIRTITKDR
jgi:hypothetical protein